MKPGDLLIRTPGFCVKNGNGFGVANITQVVAMFLSICERGMQSFHEMLKVLYNAAKAVKKLANGTDSREM